MPAFSLTWPASIRCTDWLAVMVELFKLPMKSGLKESRNHVLTIQRNLRNLFRSENQNSHRGRPGKLKQQMKKSYLKKANRVHAILQSAKAANVEAKNEAAREAGVGTWHDWSNPVRKEIDAKFLPRTITLNARIQKVGQSIAAVKSGTKLPPQVRKEIVMKRKAKNAMEREALDLANQEQNIGKMDVWSEAYQKAHADWMLRCSAFEDKYGVSDMDAYNQIEQYACAR